MITTGKIKKIEGNTYTVEIPIFSGIPDSRVDLNKEVFEINALACGLPSASCQYEPGDTVFISFVHNNMGLPVILGHAINIVDAKTLKNVQCKGKPSLVLSGLSFSSNIEGQAPRVELPADTKFYLSSSSKSDSASSVDSSYITVDQLNTVITVINTLSKFGYTDSNGQKHGYNSETETGDGINTILALLAHLGKLATFNETESDNE